MFRAQKLEVSTQELQERFVRERIRSRNTEGSGLGLSIAKSLTELMDGTFELSLEGDYFQVILTFPVCERKMKQRCIPSSRQLKNIKFLYCPVYAGQY